jgi:hypothetical protein
VVKGSSRIEAYRRMEIDLFFLIASLMVPLVVFTGVVWSILARAQSLGVPCGVAWRGVGEAEQAAQKSAGPTPTQRDRTGTRVPDRHLPKRPAGRCMHSADHCFFFLLLISFPLF